VALKEKSEFYLGRIRTVKLLATVWFSVAVHESIIGVRSRRITIAPTKSGRRTQLDTELHRRAIRTERLDALTGALIVRISKMSVRIPEIEVAATAGHDSFLTERPCGANGQ